MNETFLPTNISAPTSSDSKTNHLQIFTMFIYSVICVLGVTGNGLVIYVTCFKMKKTVNTLWFMNLAVADFVFTFFLIFSITNTARNYDWPFGNFMCKFNSFVVVLNMFASIFLLTAISLDRCLSTWVVAWVQNERTLFKANISCFFIWLASISCSIPYCIYREAKFNEHTQTTPCSLKMDTPTFKHLTVFRFVVGFLLPLMTITSSYVAIGIRVRRLRQKTLKPFRTILAVILAFFFCWLPFHIYMFITLRFLETGMRDVDFKYALDMAGPLIVSLAYFNSCLNPFLYVFMCEEFRIKLRQSLVAVLESAFAEEHLALLVSEYSMSHRKSYSQSVPSKDDTQSSGLHA